MIKAIIFDLGGVCLSNCFDYYTRKKIAEKFGLPFTKMNKLYKRYEAEINTGRKEMDHFLDELKNIGLQANIHQVKQYIDSLSEKDMEVLGLVEKLRNDYMLATLANESKEFDISRRIRFNLDSYFDYLFSSWEIGCQKPDKRAYTYALEKLRLSPAEALFIDNKEVNVNAALEMGINAILFKDIDVLLRELCQFNIKID